MGDGNVGPRKAYGTEYSGRTVGNSGAVAPGGEARGAAARGRFARGYFDNILAADRLSVGLIICTKCGPRVRCMNTILSGVMMGRWSRWWLRFEVKSACRRVANRRAARSLYRHAIGQHHRAGPTMGPRNSGPQATAARRHAGPADRRGRHGCEPRRRDRAPLWLAQVSAEELPRLSVIFADNKSHNHSLNAWLAEHRST